MVFAMSDPVTNIEIEDVLSSIRRLVSETGRSSQAPSFPVGLEIESEQSVERLVLTPALRVPAGAFEEPEIEDEHLETLAYQEESVESEGVVDISLPVDDANTAAVFSHVEYTGSSDGSGDQMADEVEISEADVYDEDDPDEDLYGAIEADVTESEASGIPLPDDFDSRILRWESISKPEVEPYEPDEPGDSDYAGTNVESLEWRDTSDVDIAEATIETMAQDVETEAIAYTIDAVDEAVAPELSGADLDDALMIDEAVLRDVVSDIVRQELQGALGERITRNVRKLVRREIHRALAAHDLS